MNHIRRKVWIPKKEVKNFDIFFYIFFDFFIILGSLGIAVKGMNNCTYSYASLKPLKEKGEN
jgi:hypothetical protein